MSRESQASTPVGALVSRARDGDVDAYAAIVGRFQDMAVGYAYAILRDAHLAEDAAQEAFLEAFRCLGSLREPAAFPGWFRRIVFKQCDRLTRVRRAAVVPLDQAQARASVEARQAAEVERRETAQHLFDAIDELPERVRAAVTLFHIGEHSHAEVAEFLGVPVSTVKKRLHDGRARLREILLATVEDSLRERRPSRDERFASHVVDLLDAARRGDTARVRELLLRDGRLLGARDALGNTALVIAVNWSQTEVAALLEAAGVVPDIHEASSIGRTPRVELLLDEDPCRLDAFSQEGFTPLALASHFGHAETVGLLVDRGADVNVVARHAMRVTPLHAALFGKRIGVARMLLASGADPNARRAGGGPRSGWTPLHYAAGFGYSDLVDSLVEYGAGLETQGNDGRTPLRVAIDGGQSDVARRLRRRGARR